jgi:hypothetical protein
MGLFGQIAILFGPNDVGWRSDPKVPEAPNSCYVFFFYEPLTHRNTHILYASMRLEKTQFSKSKIQKKLLSINATNYL